MNKKGSKCSRSEAIGEEKKKRGEPFRNDEREGKSQTGARPKSESPRGNDRIGHSVREGQREEWEGTEGESASWVG